MRKNSKKHRRASIPAAAWNDPRIHLIETNLDAYPDAMKRLPNWAFYRLEPNEEPDKKPRKVLYGIDCQISRDHFNPERLLYYIRRVACRSNDPSTWVSYERMRLLWAYNLKEIAAGREAIVHGVGFIFNASAGMVGIDLDDCIDPATGEIYPAQKSLLESLNTYTERSQSGRGAKAIVLGDIPVNGKKDGTELFKAFEIYKNGRGFLMTGDMLPGFSTQVESRPTEVLQLFNAAYPNWEEEQAAKTKRTKAAAERCERAVASGVRSLPDDQILQKAFAAKNGPAIKALFQGDTSAYDDDLSRADQALCSYLCFYSNGDSNLVESLARQSALAREKWDEPRAGYSSWLNMTICKVIAGTSTFYGDSPRQRQDAQIAAELGDLAGIEIDSKASAARLPIKCTRCKEVLEAAGDQCECDRRRTTRAARQAQREQERWDREKAKRAAAGNTRSNWPAPIGNDGASLISPSPTIRLKNFEFFDAEELQALGDDITASLKATRSLDFITPELPSLEPKHDPIRAYFDRNADALPFRPPCQCQNPNTVFGRKLDGSGLHMMVKLRCKGWGCFWCAQILRREWTQHISKTLQEWHRNYDSPYFSVVDVPRGKWASTQKAIERSGDAAFYNRFDDSSRDSLLIIATATANLPGAQQLTLQQTIALATRTIANGRFQAKGITLSQGWGLNKVEKKDPEFEMVGRCPEMSLKTLKAILQDSNINTDDVAWRPPQRDPGGRVMARIFFTMRASATRSDRMHLYSCLFDAEVKFRQEDFEGIDWGGEASRYSGNSDEWNDVDRESNKSFSAAICGPADDMQSYLHRE